jgi:hypothetical protein
MKLEAPPIIITILVAAAIASVGAIMAVRASRAKPSPAIAQFAGLIPTPAHFEERWLPEAAILKKQDRLPLIEQPPLLMRIERTLVPEDKPAVTKSKRVERKQVERKRDVCQRHGMRKVKHGRHGWRCRR